MLLPYMLYLCLNNGCLNYVCVSEEYQFYGSPIQYRNFILFYTEKGPHSYPIGKKPHKKVGLQGCFLVTYAFAMHLPYLNPIFY